MSRGRGRRHDAIRRALADAACSLIADEGAHALTVRRVAAAADASPGQVQHYFADRGELMLGAFDAIQEQVATEVATALPESSSPGDVLRAVLAAMIPDDAAGMRRLRVMAQFETLALTEHALAVRIREGHGRLRGFLGELVASAAAVEADVADDAAQRLLATAEGLSGEVLLGQESAERASRLLHAAVDEVLERTAG